MATRESWFVISWRESLIRESKMKAFGSFSQKILRKEMISIQDASFGMISSGFRRGSRSEEGHWVE
jgi:hypothetical protein